MNWLIEMWDEDFWQFEGWWKVDDNIKKITKNKNWPNQGKTKRENTKYKNGIQWKAKHTKVKAVTIGEIGIGEAAGE